MAYAEDDGKTSMEKEELVGDGRDSWAQQLEEVEQRPSAVSKATPDAIMAFGCIDCIVCIFQLLEDLSPGDIGCVGVGIR